MTKKKILIATGGTGGHIFPAYSLANYLISENYIVQMTSDKRGLQYLKNYKNLNIKTLPSSPLLKKNILKFVVSFLIIIFSILRSLIFLLFNRPSLVIGMGGYSSFPICIAASVLKVKYVIYENNLVLGKANKYLLPFAKKIFVSYKDLEGIIGSNREKVLETGNIIRKELINLKDNNYEIDKLDELKILVLGGSQAAKIFANELPQIFEKVKNSYSTIKVFQQCQKNQNDQLSQFYKKAKIDYEIFNFTDNIDEYYLKSNLVITRSGASVLAELINVKIPFIAIPLPTSADNHQYKNAKFYEKKGYGFLLEEKDIKSKLYSLIESIFKNKSLVRDMLSNQQQYSDKKIFSNLNILIRKIINEKN